MGAMGRDGTMEPWGHERGHGAGCERHGAMRSWGGKGRAEAAEKAMIRSEAGRDGTMGPWDHGAPWSGKGGGGGKGERAEGAGRAERAGMHWDPKVS